jgi:hypothetical protein
MAVDGRESEHSNFFSLPPCRLAGVLYLKLKSDLDMEEEVGPALAVIPEAKRVRSIEKSRTSSCQFADLVAEAVLARLRSLEIQDPEVKGK